MPAPDYLSQVLAALQALLAAGVPAVASRVYLDDAYERDAAALPCIVLDVPTFRRERRGMSAYPGVIDHLVTVELHCLAAGDDARATAREIAAQIEEAWMGAAATLTLGGLVKAPGTTLVAGEFVDDTRNTDQQYTDLRLQAQVQVFTREGAPRTILT